MCARRLCQLVDVGLLLGVCIWWLIQRCLRPGYGTVAVDLAAEAKKLKEAAANAKPGDPLYVHLPGQNAPPPVA